jgi:hypothetical protein
VPDLVTIDRAGALDDAALAVLQGELTRFPFLLAGGGAALDRLPHPAHRPAPLAIAATEAMLRSVLGRSPPAAFLDEVHHLAEGVPGAIVGEIEQARARGAIQLSPAGWVVA